MNLKARLQALEERLMPLKPWDEIMAHMVKQMRSTCLSPDVVGGGYVETPPELMQYAEYFLYSTAEEYADRHAPEYQAIAE